MEFNKTWQEARSQGPLPSSCFRVNQKKKWPPQHLIGWDIFDFSSETTEQNSMKLDRRQDLNALYQVCVFSLIGKTRWLPRHFNFFSKTTERNSTKLDRKQDLNILYWVGVFQANRKNKKVPSCQKKRHIVLRCTICGPLSPLLMDNTKNKNPIGICC